MRVVYTFLFALGVHACAAQGFFMDAWKPLSAPARLDAPYASPVGSPVTVSLGDTLNRVSPWLFGNNANQWMGPMVNQPVLLREIRDLDPGVIRYPGGNASNEFFWNGRVPPDAPDTLIFAAGPRREHYFTGAHGLSVDDYYRMLDSTGSTGIICVNVGYARYGRSADPVAAAAHLAADWVRYDHGRTRFWELGNENFGNWQAGYRVDTSVITGDIYGRIARVFIDSMRAAAVSDIRIGVVLVEQPGRTWNKGALLAPCDFYIVHSYYTPWRQNTSTDSILASAIPVTNQMMDYMRTLGDKPVALTEYNIFAEGSRQQVSYIAGMHAALVVGQLATRGFGLACRWDLANAYANGNDHGLFNKGDEPGAPLWKPRPAYYYLYYFRKCFGDHIVRSSVAGDTSVRVFASAFTGARRGLGVVVVNTGTAAHTVRLAGHGYYYSLTGSDSSTEVRTVTYKTDGVVESPPQSVQYVILQP